ncbi:heavy metal translocating P-type ATPase [Desulfococcaceae bacterium HSG8]|nr:heavy metal translocating P-type ATPase [Desulfococcaceae bacterium HSG8]
MFIEVCFLCVGLHAASKLYKKISEKILKSDTAYQDFIQKKIDPFFGNIRDQQLQTLSHTEVLPKISKEEKDANRRLGVASVNLSGALVCKLLYPPLLITTIPVTLWLCLRHFKNAYRSLFKEHRISIAVLDTILVLWGTLAHYFFVGALSIFLFSLSEKLLSKTRDNSRKKLINVFSQHPCYVWILVGGSEVEIPFEQLKTDDIVVVNAGEIIPADGTITSGIASIDQRALTGESQPAEKGTGEQVFASTIVLSGKIHMRAEKTGQETVAVKLGEILNHTTEYKTTLESKTERIVDWSALPTLVLSGLAYPVAGTSGSLAVLLSSIGYNMRILSPLSTLNFLCITSQDGILIKDGRALEKLAKIDTVVFDKTGTLTLEQPLMSNIYSFNGLSDNVLLTYAAAAECRQEHPISRAILVAAGERKLKLPKIDDKSYEVGYGIRVILSDQLIRVGSKRFIEMENIPIPSEMEEIEAKCGNQGYSLVLIAVNEELAGVIELHPATRPESKQVIRQLRERNIMTYIISGDQENPTQNLAGELGTDRYFPNTLPEQKAEIVEQLQQEGKTVCFVGDGINDSIALKKADVSISLRGAATAATDTAQIVLMDENLKCLTHLIGIAEKFENNQKKNLMITVVPSIICIGGVFLMHFGIYTSIILYYGSLFAGILNSTKPLLINPKKIDSLDEFSQNSLKSNRPPA